MKYSKRQGATLAAFSAMSLALAAPANASTFVLDLTGDVGAITNFQQDAFGLHFDRYFLNLSGLDAGNAITVGQGDEIDTTVTFNQLLSIPGSGVRTDFLQFLFGDGFTGNQVETTGTFSFFNAGNLVASLSYGAGTSGQIAGFGILFPPDNGPIAFDSFTNFMTITSLDAPATLNASAFNYNLVSSAVPEPATWGMMILGFGLIGGAMRRRTAVRVTYA